MDGAHLVPVATGVSDFEAKLLAARLGADGILWQTRGIVDSIYPFGGIDVLVPADQLDDANEVLALLAGARSGDGTRSADPDLDPGPDLDLDRTGSGAPLPRTAWWFGLAAVGAVVAVTMVRVLAVG